MKKMRMMMKMKMICQNMTCGVTRMPELKRKLHHQNLNPTLLKLKDPEVNPDPETGTRDLEVPQAQAPTPQGLGAEVGGRESGKAPRDPARGSVEGKAGEGTRAPLAAGRGPGTVKRRQRVTYLTTAF